MQKDFEQICEEAKTAHHLSQNGLAKRIGLHPKNFSAIIRGRRPLPAEAAIELFDLTGIHPREILKAAARTAAVAVFAIVTLFVTMPKNGYANTMSYSAKMPEIQIMRTLPGRMRSGIAPPGL